MIRRISRRIGPAILGSLGAAVGLQFIVLLTGILAARLLGPVDRGHLALIWTVTLVITQIGTLGLPLAVTYEIATSRASMRSLIQDIGPSIRRQIVVVTAVQAVAISLLVTFTATPTWPAVMSLLVVPASLVQAFVISGLQGAQRFRPFNILRVMAVGVYAILLTVLATLGTANLVTVTGVWVTGWVVAGVASTAVARRATQNDGTEYAASVSYYEMRQFGLRGLFGWVSPTETLRIDQLAVGLVLSAYDLGLYVAALAFTNLPRFLAQAVGNVAYPRIAAEEASAKRWTLVWKFTALSGAISAVVAIGLAASASPLIRTAFGTDFASAIEPLRLLLAATVILCVRRTLSDGLRGVGMPGAASRAEAVSWLMLVPLLPALGLTAGLTGVALALGGAYTASLVMLLVVTFRSRAASRSSGSVALAPPHHQGPQ